MQYLYENILVLVRTKCLIFVLRVCDIHFTFAEIIICIIFNNNNVVEKYIEGIILICEQLGI